MTKKIGRNDKCPCGSGEKYKKCCIDSERSFNSPSAQIEVPSIFSQYNSIDLVKTFAGLTLLSQNHGKNVRLEELTRRSIANFNHDTPQIPITELRNYLGKHYASHYMEDLSTNLFTDLVTFYGGDYIIFPGISDGGNYVLSNQLTAIYNWPDSGIPEQFKTNCMHASLLILNLSNEIAQRLGYSRYLVEEVKNNLISIPGTTRLEELKSAVTFSESEIQQLLHDKTIAPEALGMFVLDLDDPEIANEHTQESPLLVKPIVYQNEEYIIASPGTLSYALVDFINSEAKLSGNLAILNNAYHNLIWNYTQLHLKQLGFSAIEIPAITAINDTGIREKIYRFDEDKLAYVQYVFTGGREHQKRKQQIINDILAQSEFADHEFMDITLVSSMGQELFFSFGRVDNSKSIGMPIHDFETFVKLKEHSAFDLWKFATAREEQISDSSMFGASFLDIFKVYKENDDSFYVSDESTHSQIHIEPGYASDLYQEAKLLSDEHSIQRVIEIRRVSIPVARSDKFAPIYYSIDELLGGDLNLAVENFTQPIWVTSGRNSRTIPAQAKGLYVEMTEAIAYWIWQCQEYIKDDLAGLGDTPITFQFEFDQENRFNPIERNFERDPAFNDHFTVHVNNYVVSISIPPTIIPYLYGADNEGERVLLRHILIGLNQILISNQVPVLEEARIQQIVDDAAPLGAKKKIFILDTSDNLLLDPSNLKEYRYIQSYDINVISNSLVPDLGKLCPPIGDITDKAVKTKLTRDIVMRVLLPKLQASISQYPNENLLKKLLSLNESLIQKREDLRIKTPTRIACFVSVNEQTKDLQDILSKLNRTTIAVRCLIEHLAAEPSSGNKIVSTTAIDELIAIMSVIIDWGSMGDQIEFELFEIEMGILPSGRVGTEKKLFNEIFDPYYSSKSKENVLNALDTFEQAFPQVKPILGSDVPENLDNAFSQEFGISLTRICEFINDLGIIAYQQPSPYASISSSVLLKEMNQYDHTYTSEEFNTAMNYLCLTNRGKVHHVPEGFDNIDISPWRFNRRLSLLRKPLIAVNNREAVDDPTIYWGFRQLLTTRNCLYDQCTTNRLRVSEDGPIQRVLGKLAQRSGKALVESVLHELKNDQLIIDSEVPINTKSLLKHDKDIGDVDVLVIDRATKIIYSLECKSMAPSRNIKEMIGEVDKLFGGESEKGWIGKHVERDEWLKNNLNLVSSKYQLDLSDYNVKSFFVTQEDMLTPYLKTRQLSMPFVTLYTLKEKGLSVFV